MAEVDKDMEDSSSRGADWEVVSLTASAYAASPGTKGFDIADQHNDTKLIGDEQGASDPMFMSGHFVFPPNEHENLPIEPKCTEIHNEPTDLDLKYNDKDKGDGTKRTGEDNWKSKSDDDLHGVQFFEDGKRVSVPDVEFEESDTLHGMALTGKDQIIYGTPEFGALDAEANVSQSVLCDYTAEIPESEGLYEKSQVTHSDCTNTSTEDINNGLDSNNGESGKCEARWKRDALSLYSHIKEANKFWSVVVAAAVVGLVIWGHRWRRENLQLEQLKLQSIIHREGMSDRLKDALRGGNQRGSFMRGGDTFSSYTGL